MGGTVVGRIDN